MTATRPQRRQARLRSSEPPQAVKIVDAMLAGDAYQPTVPVNVRDAVYFLTLGTAAASALATGLAAIWFPDIAPQVLATGGVATTVMGIIGGGVGVVYRPGVQHGN